jgi:drug/metabolite transporter (DMT)-like permease
MTAARSPLWVLVLLTLVWGLNWPVMKMGVSGTPAAPSLFPPLTFRALSMLAGLPILGAALWLLKVPLRVARPHWAELGRLALTNMVIWHVIAIVAVQALSSGRAAILGYSMPVFSALWGVLVFGDRFTARQTLGVAAAGLGIVLLLAHEFGTLSGSPVAACGMLLAACVWAYGTHRLRRTTLPLPLLTIAFWMTALSALVMCVLSTLLEHGRWPGRLPPQPHVVWAIAYNAVGVFAFAQAAWFYLARHMPPVASSISVMMIPVLGTFSGAWALSEPLHWQDFAAMALMVVAIAAVLLKPAVGARAVKAGTGP